MVLRTADKSSSADVKTYKWAVHVVNMTTNDTHAFSEFNTAKAIVNAFSVRADTGAEVTNSISYNIVALTQPTITSTDIIIFAFGEAA